MERATIRREAERLEKMYVDMKRESLHAKSKKSKGIKKEVKKCHDHDEKAVKNKALDKIQQKSEILREKLKTEKKFYNEMPEDLKDSP